MTPFLGHTDFQAPKFPDYDAKFALNPVSGNRSPKELNISRICKILPFLLRTWEMSLCCLRAYSFLTIFIKRIPIIGFRNSESSIFSLFYFFFNLIFTYFFSFFTFFTFTTIFLQFTFYNKLPHTPPIIQTLRSRFIPVLFKLEN